MAAWKKLWKEKANTNALHCFNCKKGIVRGTYMFVVRQWKGTKFYCDKCKPEGPPPEEEDPLLTKMKEQLKKKK